MWFHTKIDDTILFDFWTVKTAWEMSYSCAILLVASILVEVVKWLRWRVEKQWEGSLPTSYAQRLFHPSHLIQVLLFLVQIVLSYMLMLAFMTFSVWIGLAIAIGSGIGYYLFGSRPIPQSPHGQREAAEEECCG
ncbi:unnamed protein product, partial [Mesorhabditis belari]|uniref:Copper transport protein n=1 Tax=Mesorhabditis belari TaxID=2138241 RepID=A0AAF3FAR3_9BILA